MILTPQKGIGSVTFGMARSEVLRALGKPDEAISYNDEPGYPEGRELLEYGGIDILLTPQHGVHDISVTW